MFTRDYELSEMLRFARQKHALGDLEYSDRVYGLILKDRPADRDTLLSYSLLKIQKGELDEAAVLLDRLSEYFGREADTYYLKALVANENGDESEARRMIRIALTDRPDFIECHHMLAALDMKGPPFRDFIADLHRIRQPDTYLEIGVDSGASLELAKDAGRAIGVDPFPRVERELGAQTQLFELESDAFFNLHGHALFDGRGVDLAFIDGLHEARQALRDLLNCERFSRPGGIVLMHDVVPLDAATSTSERNTFFWSGDVWKVLVAVTKYFPDLSFFTVACPPTGVAVFQQLKPDRGVTPKILEEVCDFMDVLRYEDVGNSKERRLNIVDPSIIDFESVFAIQDPRS